MREIRTSGSNGRGSETGRQVPRRSPTLPKSALMMAAVIRYVPRALRLLHNLVGQPSPFLELPHSQNVLVKPGEALLLACRVWVVLESRHPSSSFGELL